MSITIDVTGVPATHYLFAPSPLAELGSALHLLVEPATTRRRRAGSPRRPPGLTPI